MNTTSPGQDRDRRPSHHDDLGSGNDTRQVTQHENGDLRKIKVCVNLRKVGHPTLRKLSMARKGL